MPVSSILRSIISLFFIAGNLSSYAQAVDTVQPVKRKLIDAASHQLRISVDIAKPIANSFTSNNKNYEATIDYYFKKEIYLVAEGGFGNSTIDYTDLKYNTSSAFIRLGVDKCMLQRLFPKDWDMAFIGVRYGLGSVKRSDATYVVNDSLWGPTNGTIDGRNFTAHWAEIVAGIRVELYRGLIAGWNVRAKFLLNAKTFQDLSPSYISGYGKGDKSTAFDFNFYLCYALRWGGSKRAAASSNGSVK